MKIHDYRRNNLKNDRTEEHLVCPCLRGKPVFAYEYYNDAVKKTDKMRKIRSGCQTFAVVAMEWEQSIASHVKESTFVNYQMKIKKHIIPYFGHSEMKQITLSDLYQFILQKQKSGLSERYISDIIVLMKSIWKYANQVHGIKNPFHYFSMPRKKHTEIKLLNESEQNVLKQWIHSNDSLTAVGIALSFYMGVRIGELCALRWTDIDLKRKMIAIKHTLQRIQNPNGTSKTKLIFTEPKSITSIREIPIPRCIFPFLKSHQSGPEKYVLSGNDMPIEPRVMQYRFARILKKEHLPSVHFHALRHMFATNCIALGFDIKSLSEILGHASVEITLNRYVHASMKQKQKLMDRID